VQSYIEYIRCAARFTTAKSQSLWPALAESLRDDGLMVKLLKLPMEDRFVHDNSRKLLKHKLTTPQNLDTGRETDRLYSL
jgi:hypothetical protein